MIQGWIAKRRNDTDQKDTPYQTTINKMSLIHRPCNQLVVAKFGYQSSPQWIAVEWIDAGRGLYIRVSIFDFNECIECVDQDIIIYSTKSPLLKVGILHNDYFKVQLEKVRALSSDSTVIQSFHIVHRYAMQS